MTPYPKVKGCPMYSGLATGVTPVFFVTLPPALLRAVKEPRGRVLSLERTGLESQLPSQRLLGGIYTCLVEFRETYRLLFSSALKESTQLNCGPGFPGGQASAGGRKGRSRHTFPPHPCRGQEVHCPYGDQEG